MQNNLTELEFGSWKNSTLVGHPHRFADAPPKYFGSVTSMNQPPAFERIYEKATLSAYDQRMGRKDLTAGTWGSFAERAARSLAAPAAEAAADSPAQAPPEPGPPASSETGPTPPAHGGP